MTRGKRVSVEIRRAVRKMLSNGKKRAEIESDLDLPTSTVRRIAVTRDTGGIIKRGRKKKLDPNQRRFLLRHVRNNPTISSSKVRSALNLPVSDSTVLRELAASDFHNRKVHVVPALTDASVQKRLLFARLNARFTSEWRSVIFSDEKKFNLTGPDGWNRRWSEGRQIQSLARSQTSRASVMVWGAIFFGGKLSILRVTTTLNAERYIGLLRDHVLPEARRLAPANFKFQQDNAPCHSARATKNFLATSGVPVLDWPPYSPDLNPIENVWSQLSRAVYADETAYSNVGDLWTAIEQKWRALDQASIDACIESMHTRCLDVVQAGGKRIGN